MPPTRYGPQVASVSEHYSGTRSCSPWNRLTATKTTGSSLFKVLPPQPSSDIVKSVGGHTVERNLHQRILVGEGVKTVQVVYRRDILENMVLTSAQQRFGNAQWLFQLSLAHVQSAKSTRAGTRPSSPNHHVCEMATILSGSDSGGP